MRILPPSLPAVLLFGCLAALPSQAAILPETIGHWQRGEPAPASIPDAKVWTEYGLKASETSPYSDAGEKFSITAYRFADGTGAMAAYDQLRPANARPAQLMGLAAEDDHDQYVAAGNYLFIFHGYRIKPEELSHVVATVPTYSHSPLPTLPKYLPSGLQANSERYITGPESLARFAPSIPPSAVGFHFSAEGQLAKYGSPGKETTVLIFSYPTMEMARDRYAALQQVPGALAKRTGPLVAVALGGTSPDATERLLAQIKYEATITVAEHPPTAKDNPINLFWNIVKLCLVIIGFCVAAGLAFGGLRVLMNRSGYRSEDDTISLRLTGRR
jgi:hypothetical protein